MIDEKTIALIDVEIQKILARRTETGFTQISQETLDEVAPAMTVDEHNKFFQMFASILYHLYRNLDFESEATKRDFDVARHMKTPEALLALVELVERRCYMEMLTPLVGTVKAKEMCRGRRSVPHPVTNAIADYLKENPTATAKHIWRVADEWLPEGAWLEDDEINFTVNGNERKVNFESFKKLVTNAKKLTDK